MQQYDTQGTARRRIEGWRIYGLPARGSDGLSAREGAQLFQGEQGTAEGGQEISNRLIDVGFNTVLVSFERALQFPFEAGHALSSARGESTLNLMLDARLDGDGRIYNGDGYQPLVDCLEVLAARQRMPDGLILRDLAALRQEARTELLTALRQRYPDLQVVIWTPGMRSDDIAALEGLPLDGVVSSLPWWNFRDLWLTEEHERLRAVAPILAPLGDPRHDPGAEGGLHDPDIRRRLAVALLVGDAVLVPAHLMPLDALASPFHDLGEVPESVVSAREKTRLHRLTGPLAGVTGLFRGKGEGRLLLVNPDDGKPAHIATDLIQRRLPNGFMLADPCLRTDVFPARFELEPGSWKWVPLRFRASMENTSARPATGRGNVTTALRRPRIAIESVTPTVDDGAFAAKRTLGETIVVRANIFMDGHDNLAAEVLWRSVDTQYWHSAPMRAQGNDAWEACIQPERLGRHVFMLRAWLDRWQTYTAQLSKKFAAGVDIGLELQEGRQMLEAFAHGADGVHDVALRRIQSALAALDLPPGEDSAHPIAGDERVAVLLAADLAEAVHVVDARAFLVETPRQYPLEIERHAAAFSSWYEIFPRSQSPDPGRHGTFQDVIDKLPFIRRMGFDVLYFPPIHPIGMRNRKGRNNALQAEPGDPGSPYAVGSEAGGHEAVHPELGTLEDFQQLVAAAKTHDLEIALDFAIQCSPDHPWLRDHPDWFNWRADGSLRYAENPPKRYEDIVNPDFYCAGATPARQAALWWALRDIVLFWARQGVRIFRVDNPHTKPLPFWQWMLTEVKDRYPDTIFLSEAFTRPAMMYRLAKVGFSQSYSYFTWRNTRQELTDYMTELNEAPVRDFFRPNFFVNTPDINPRFLQTSGRPGFLIRAALAATLSGSWGVYNGFEQCVADAVPGKEEYLDSEKYQLRQWRFDTPGNIVDEITRLNRIRRSHPALQSHLGIRFHRVDNDQLIFYSRRSAEGDSVVLVMVNLDPHHTQSATFELPFWEWGLPDDARVHLFDLFHDRRFHFDGRHHRIELSPDQPFVLWARVQGEGDAA